MRSSRGGWFRPLIEGEIKISTKAFDFEKHRDLQVPASGIELQQVKLQQISALDSKMKLPCLNPYNTWDFVQSHHEQNSFDGTHFRMTSPTSCFRAPAKSPTFHRFFTHNLPQITFAG
jgi:hypothetical protein